MRALWWFTTREGSRRLYRLGQPPIQHSPLLRGAGGQMLGNGREEGKVLYGPIAIGNLKVLDFESIYEIAKSMERQPVVLLTGIFVKK